MMDLSSTGISQNSLLKCENTEESFHIPQSIMDVKDYQVEIDFQQYWLVIKRHWRATSFVFFSVAISGTIFALFQKPIFEAEGRLLFKVNSISSLTGLGDRALDQLGRLESVDSKSSLLDTQAEIIRSASIIQETIQSLNLRDEDGNFVDQEDFLKDLTVKGVTGTDTLRISYKAKSPEDAAEIVNKIMNIFLKKNIQANRAEPSAAREFIEHQLPATEAKVEQASLALRRFKETHGIVSLSEEASKTVQNISNLNEQLANAKANLADMSARSNELQAQVRTNPRQAILYATIGQSPGIQDLLEQLQKAQRELAVQRTRFISGPPIKKLEEQVTALEALLKQKVFQLSGGGQAIPLSDVQTVGKTEEELVSKLIDSETQRLGLIQRINALSDIQEAYKKWASSIPALEQEQRMLERNLDAAQKTYIALLTRKQEIQVAENQTIGNARIISEAQIPKKATASKKKLIFAGSIFAATLLAIASAFALDLLDRSVKTIKEAKEIFGYTLLGVIPTITISQSQKASIAGRLEHPVPNILLREEPPSWTFEAFQLLQANLKFLASDKPLKTIVVTSSVAAEGKSFVAANLAAIAAQIGQRVLLVDADLRRPTQHHIWDHHLSSSGLSNVIVEQLPFEEVLVEVMPNLFLLPAGVIPPNSIALLDSNRMISLIHEFSKNFDLVVFDSPPLVGKADAAILGKVVDGILFVVRPNFLDLPSAKAAKEFLTQSGQHVLGMVVNGVDVKHGSDGYFYYSHSGNSKVSHKARRYSEI